MLRPSLFIALNLAVVALFVLIAVLRPLAVDTAHVSDTLLLGQLGWRGVNGVFPIADYPHFWAGLTADLMTLSFTLFGVSFKAIDYAFVLMFALSSVLMLMMSWNRLRPIELTLLLGVAAALVISMQPVGMSHPRQTHSYVYNHVALVLMTGMAAFALTTAKSRSAEIIGALTAGASLYFLVMLKTTFAAFVPAILLACLIQTRWLALGLMVVGAGAVMVALDPGLTRVLVSLDYLMGSTAADRSGGLSKLIRRAYQFAADDAALPLIVLGLAGVTLYIRGRAALPMVVSALLIGGAWGATIMTMGGKDDRKMIPLLIVTIMLLTALLFPARQDGSRGAAAEEDSTPLLLGLRVVPAALAYGMILPALLSALIGGWRGVQNNGLSLVEDGPLVSYYAYGLSTNTLRHRDLPDAAARLDVAIERTRRFLNEGKVLESSGEFVALADGVALLQDIPDVQQLGIVGNGRMFEFTMPLQSKVVPEFPVWPSPGQNAPLRSFEDMPDSVDVVMLSEPFETVLLFNDTLVDLMGDAFMPCRQSEFWTMYIRRSLEPDYCSQTLGS